jgi:hypothetical protein
VICIFRCSILNVTGRPESLAARRWLFGEQALIRRRKKATSSNDPSTPDPISPIMSTHCGMCRPSRSSSDIGCRISWPPLSEQVAAAAPQWRRQNMHGSCYSSLNCRKEEVQCRALLEISDQQYMHCFGLGACEP